MNSTQINDLRIAASFVNEYLRASQARADELAGSDRADHVLERFILSMSSICGDTSCWGKFIRDWAFVSYTRRIDWRSKFYLFPRSMDAHLARSSYLHPVALQSQSPFTITYDFRNQFVALCLPDCLMFDFDVDVEKLRGLCSEAFLRMRECIDRCDAASRDGGWTGAGSTDAFDAIRNATQDGDDIDRPDLSAAFAAMGDATTACDALQDFMRSNHVGAEQSSDQPDSFAAIRDAVLRNVVPDDHVRALVAIKKAQVQSYCRSLCSQCPVLTFALFETDRGVHVFMVSQRVDRDNLLWIDFMLKVCNDTWYSAFAWRAGFFVRLNKKATRKNDFVARLGVGSPHRAVDTVELESAFWERRLSFPMPPAEPDLGSDEDFIVAGASGVIDPEVYRKVRLHYLLVTYFKDFHGETATSFECASGEYLIRSLRSETTGRADADSMVARIRRDVEQIATLVGLAADTPEMSAASFTLRDSEQPSPSLGLDVLQGIANEYAGATAGEPPQLL